MSVLSRCALVLFVPLACHAGEALVELETADASHRGRLFARTSNACWLLGANGEIGEVALDEVTTFRKLGEFRPASLSVLGDQLRREFGRSYDVSKTREYVVVAPRGRAGAYANLFDRTYRTFQLYFRVRRFDVPSPEFPLVVVVHATRAEFVADCRDRGVDANGFSGFYLGKSNRIVTYEVDTPTTSARATLDRTLLSRVESSSPRLDVEALPHTVAGGIGPRTESLLIHEATHQLGYNCGLHARLGWNPKWTVEGLATLFEAPGVRKRSSSRSIADRVNPGRLRDFREYVSSRRKAGAIVDVIESDQRLRTAVSDFYAESWALTFFLVETRPREYARYMQAIADREPFHRYTAEQRRADFETAFGSHLDLLDAEFVRFIAKLD